MTQSPVPSGLANSLQLIHLQLQRCVTRDALWYVCGACLEHMLCAHSAEAREGSRLSTALGLVLR